MADQATITETWPLAEEGPIAETWPVADQLPVVETWPVAEQTPIVEVAPQADAPIVAAPPTARRSRSLRQHRSSSNLPPNYRSSSSLTRSWRRSRNHRRTGPKMRGRLSTKCRTPVSRIHANASAEQAVSEATPPPSPPSAAEISMEVTPEQGQSEAAAEVVERAAAAMEPLPHEAPEPVPDAHVQVEEEARQAVVVPLARTHIKPESASVPFTPSEDAALMHTLRVAAARGASTVYVVAQSKPMIRIDGEIGPLESEPTLTAADVDRLVMELAPPRRRDALQNGPVEWLCDVPEIGRVRCLTFRDHRGPGVLFRMFPPRAISADQLGLTPGSAGALPAVRRARARDRRARERQVDAAQRVRRSHQPDAQRPCDHDRVADRVRAREPAVVHQPARVARRRRARRDVRARRRCAKIPTS